MKLSCLSLLLLCTLFSCASGLKTRDESRVHTRRTVVLFVVDGLSTKLLKNSLDQGLMSHTQKYFLPHSNAFSIGRAAFPTLTYPNLASILTSKGIGQQPITANHMLLDNEEVINFESASKHDDLRDMVDPISIFQLMENQGKETASFSYVLGMNATNRMHVGIREGLDYKNHNYKYLDDRLIENLEEYLQEKESARDWPDFIYVHLVGVDALAHIHGSKSKEMLQYMHWLDKRLKSTYRIFTNAEKRGKSVITLLTADHGFVETDFFVDGEKIVEKVDEDILVTNESRFLGLYKKDSKKFDQALGALLANPGVEFIALRNGSEFKIVSNNKELSFNYGPSVCPNETYSLTVTQPGANLVNYDFQCPSFFNQSSGQYPFVVEDLSRYLNSKNHPDAVVIAKPNFAFSKHAKGNHGGPTADETLVPVLTRNAIVRGNAVIKTSDLLKDIFGAEI